MDLWGNGEKLVKQRHHVTWLSIVLLLSTIMGGCTSLPKSNKSALAKLQNELKASIALNNRLARRQAMQKRVQIPSSVDKALIKGNNTATPITNSKRYNIAVNQQSVQDFFSGLAQSSNTSFVVDPLVSANITLNLKNATLNEIFSALMSIYNFEIRKTNYGYLVAPPKIETQTFIVNYLSSNRSGGATIKSINTGSGAGGGSVGHNNTSQADFWKTITSNINSIIGCRIQSTPECKKKSIEINPLTNTVIVNAYPKDLIKVGNFINHLNHNLGKQVIIEAKALAIKLDNHDQQGIDWSILNKHADGSTTEASNDVSTLTTNNTFTFTTKDKSIKAIVKLLRSQGTLVDMSSPRITTLNNQPAMIKVGYTSYLAIGSTSTTAATTSGTTEQSSSINLQPFFSGVSLLVTPHIGTNGAITLHIHPVVSKTTSEILQATSGDSSTNIRLPTPKTTVSESDNLVQTQSGQVVVVGGMMLYSNDYKTSSLPGLVHTPFKSLAGSESNKREKYELVILLKAEIVRSKTWINDLNKTARNIVQD